MEYLHSNFPPMKSGNKTFIDKFYDVLPQANLLDIAVGYVTSDSLVELQKLMEFNIGIHNLNLIIGMHYLDRFTKIEYNAAMDLNEFLKSTNRGEVRLVTPFRYHGKLYSYSNINGPFAGIIGSNNLSSIVEGGSRVYESSIFIDELQAAVEMHTFIDKLKVSSSDNISDLEINKFNEVNPLLEGHEFVQKVNDQTVRMCLYNRSKISFDIPIKTYEVSPHSNLNVFFGKGRESKATGLVKPRHWYEVELIVPKYITSQAGYPKAKTDDAVFNVITDDGWSFQCKVSGDYSKNFRSEGDLKILGKWLKGRLENAGVLKVGEPVTQDTLRKYGRDSFGLTKINNTDAWFLDFGVKK